MADYSEQLDAIAKGPKAATADGMSVTAQDPEAIMKIEDRLKTSAAAARNHLGLNFVKLQPPGGGF